MPTALRWLLLFSAIGLVFSPIHGDTLDENSFKPSSLEDDDADGIINARDYCQATPKRAKVDNRGCPATKILLLSVELNILFDFGTSDIQPRFYGEIKKLADFLQVNSNSDVMIEGHTDDIGSQTSNLKLSQDRANAIASILVNHFNIPAKQVSAIGYGETRPISDNDTPKGRAKNRRVVAEVFVKKVTIQEKWNIYSVDKSIR